MTRRKVGDPFPDGKGFVDEVGGRESGPGAEQREDERRTSLSSAAANPAACPFCDERILPKAHARHLHDRIRELEDDNALLRTRSEEYEARVAELKAHIAELLEGRFPEAGA